MPVFFLMRDNKKGVVHPQLEWVKKWEGSGNSCGRRKHSQKIVHEKTSIFNKKKKKKEMDCWKLIAAGRGRVHFY